MFKRGSTEGNTLLLLGSKRQETSVDGHQEECNFWTEGRGRYDDEPASELSTQWSGENHLERSRSPTISQRKLFEFLSLNRFAPIELIFSSNM